MQQRRSESDKEQMTTRLGMPESRRQVATIRHPS